MGGVSATANVNVSNHVASNNNSGMSPFKRDPATKAGISQDRRKVLGQAGN